MDLSFLILLLLGLVAGLLAGLFGVGGGILFTPILFLLFNNAGVTDPVLWTIGSSLFCTFVASSGSSLRQYRQYNFYGSEGLRVGLLGAIGVFLGKQVTTSEYYTEEVFVIFFSILFVYVAFIFFQRGRKNDEQVVHNQKPVGLKEASVTGLAGGFVAALAGIGGGAVMVPIMNLYYRVPFKKTVSVSSLAIVFISLSGWLQLGLVDVPGMTLSGYTWGVVDFGTALPMALGGVMGGFAGALFNLKSNRRYLQFGFSLLALLLVIKLLTDVF